MEKATEDLERGSGAASGSARLRIPRRESGPWKRLAKCLDTILREGDYPAIDRGFIGRDAATMDAALEKIIAAATEARRIIRPNAQDHP
jgi:hypothetical protein